MAGLFPLYIWVDMDTTLLRIRLLNRVLQLEASSTEEMRVKLSRVFSEFFGSSEIPFISYGTDERYDLPMIRFSYSFAEIRVIYIATGGSLKVI